MQTIKLRALIIRDGGWLIFQCLEHDICVQAMTMPDLEQAITRTLEAQVALDLDRGDPPFANIPPAPHRFFDIYERIARKVFLDIKPVRVDDSIQIQEPELRVA